MKPEKREAKLIFGEALRLSVATERAAYLDRACAKDPELRQEVESLLAAYAQAGDFLGQPRPVPASDFLIERAGTMIGRYKLLQKIGEGGFGVVYMAEQVEPVQRKVALKIIKAGMDTREVIARFEAERQALALMDHPGIANILDAGSTEAGRPYFVMELVNGIPITDYCDRQKLPTPGRLQLFIKVCHAVQHAHQKGIIHRDLKPTNVLVTLHDGEPVPKVIDFGVVKALGQKLTQKTLFTGFQHLVGTPAYMSPEQAELSGLDIDTRSDIYSLGVLLYELLTGMTPFDTETLAKAAFDEMRRLIREAEPPKPSTRLDTLTQDTLGTVAAKRQSEPARLNRLLRGDLDWIVMKCIEKDRRRRYDTANDVALDIEHHLGQEPVTAAAPSAVYRARKFFGRHQVGLAVAAALVLLVAAGIVVSTWQAVRATRAESKEKFQRARAEQHRAVAEANEKRALTEAARSAQVAQFMKDMLNAVGPSVALGRDTTMLREILDKTAERLGKDLHDQPLVEAELRHTLGEVYWVIGDLEKAEAMFRQALEIRKGVLGPENAEVAKSMRRLAHVLWREGKLGEAEPMARGAVTMQRKLSGNPSLDLADSLTDLAVFGPDGEAEIILREALAIRRNLLGKEHAAVADSLEQLSAAMSRQAGKVEEAEGLCREALAMNRKLLGPENPSVAGSLNLLGVLLLKQGKSAEAEIAFTDALEMRRRVLGKEHPDLAQSLGNLAGLRAKQGKLQESETLGREALAIQMKLLGRDSLEVASSLQRLALVLQRQGKLREAENLLRESLTIRKRATGDDGFLAAISLHYLGCVLLVQAKLPEAEAALREAVTLFTKHNGKDDLQVAGSLYYLGLVLREQGRLSDAETVFRRAIAIRSKLNADASDSLYQLGEILRSQGRLPEGAKSHPAAAQQGNTGAE